MKSALLDSNFIITCVKEKIDFFEELSFMGFKIIIPEQVIKEIENVSNSNQKLKSRENAKFAIEILKKNNFEEIDIGKGHVDRKIIEYIKDKPEILVATLDRELKKKLIQLKKHKIVIRGKKKIEII